MAKKNQKILVLTLVLTFVLTSTAFAENPNQSSNIQKAFENVKGQLDGLITAKDENQSDELTLRITTFEKVIDLSITEAKDLKLKLLGFEMEAENEELVSWKEKMIAGTAAALKYYEAEKQVAGEDKIIDLESIKTRAKKFKEWRENKTVFFNNRQGREETVETDFIVSAVQPLPNQKLANELKVSGLSKEIDVYVIGDCREPRSLYAAIHDGYRAGREV